MSEFIPPFSLNRQAQQLADEVATAVARVLASGRYAQGPECEAFEIEIAREIAPALDGGLRALTCSSGTDALHLALRAVGVGAGDVVLTTPFTFFATAGAILLAGATPEFADISPSSFNLDPAALERAIRRPRTGRLAAILPVHLYGRVADMPAINAIAAAAGVPVVEDAAQAIAATGYGRPAGAWGQAASFSFYPTKNLGAMGEGGLVTTCDPQVEDRLCLLRAHGSRRRYEHETIGWNGRMHELQAAILRTKLPHLQGWTRRRQAIAALYGSCLREIPQVRVPEQSEGHVFHQYVIRAQKRDALRQYLKEREIGTEVYYPIPLHQQPALRQFAPLPGELTEAERATQEIVALPMFPELTDAEAMRVASTLAAFYAQANP